MTRRSRRQLLLSPVSIRMTISSFVGSFMHRYIFRTARRIGNVHEDFRTVRHAGYMLCGAVHPVRISSGCLRQAEVSQEGRWLLQRLCGTQSPVGLKKDKQINLRFHTVSIAQPSVAHLYNKYYSKQTNKQSRRQLISNS